MKYPQIVESSKNYTILKADNRLICYSYGKVVAEYNMEDKVLIRVNKDNATHTTNKHIGLFRDYIKSIL